MASNTSFTDEMRENMQYAPSNIREKFKTAPIAAAFLGYICKRVQEENSNIIPLARREVGRSVGIYLTENKAEKVIKFLINNKCIKKIKTQRGLPCNYQLLLTENAKKEEETQPIEESMKSPNSRYSAIPPQILERINSEYAKKLLNYYIKRSDEHGIVKTTNSQICKALNWDMASGNATLANGKLEDLGIIKRTVSHEVGIPTIVELLFDYDKKECEGDIYQQKNFDNAEKRSYSRAMTDAKIAEIKKNKELEQLKNEINELKGMIAEPKKEKGKLRRFFEKLFN